MKRLRFDHYKDGMRKLVASLGRDHPRIGEVLILQHRLTENIVNALKGGDSPSLRASRAQILESCNRISLLLVGTPFHVLCELSVLSESHVADTAELTLDRQREVALKAYFDQMNGLLVEGGLRTAKASDEVRDMARVQTLNVLPKLDGVQKGHVVQFLYESALITEGVGVIFMSGADLRGAYLEQTFLVEAHLAGVNFTGAYLAGAHLEWARLGEACLTGAHLEQAFLVAAYLSGASLSRADLMGAYLVGAGLPGANLVGANLEGAHLEWAYLVSANMEATNLAGANLMGAEMMWARLPRADLAEANLMGADLSYAYMPWVRLRGARYDTHTRWPEGFDPVAARAVKVDESSTL